MIYKLVVFAYLLAIAFGYSDVEYRSTFTQWMQDQSKAYKSEEFRHRFAAFKANMDYVAEWNAKNSETKLGMTIHADLTNAEYRALYLGTHIDATEKLAAARDIVASRKIVGDNYNSSVDWRTHNPPIVTGIKNQGQCGSCWSFSTTGSVEGAHALSTGKLVSLSEQNLVDCSTAQGNEGCDGGLMDQAFQYIISNKGIDTEASYPYTASGPNACKFNKANVGATISAYTDVTAGDEADLQTAASKQPVSVAIDASHASFQLYSSGVYHELFCSSTKLDHGVLVVGWGTDTTSNKAYWIVKNSWGASWGQQGYIYMSRDRNNNCGIASSASYPTV